MTPSTNNNSSNAHIFVGCGGSGIQSLTQLNLLLSQDEVWRKRLGRDVYHLAIDTDAGELDRFDQEISHQCRGAQKPYVGRIDLGKGLMNLTVPLTNYFVNPYKGASQRKLQGKERLKKHWWHDSDGNPFSAPKVADLQKGAGQCPPVSYFLAWEKMNGLLKTVFNDLQKQIVSRRSSSGAKPFESINFTIVAGLAGGTGRGSWESIAFKLRELFQKEGAITRPNAFLFDATVYRNVMRNDATQKIQMEANSITGLSQLSAWAHNQTLGVTAYQHTLPSMTSPEDSLQDVLQCDLTFDTNMSGPTWKNFILFGSNEIANLSNNKDYHNMTGTAMYLDLMDSRIASAASNQPHPFWSFGAASFEVPAAAIRNYFENISQLVFLQRFLDGGEKPQFDFVKDMRLNSGIQKPGQVPAASPKGSFFQIALEFAMQTKSAAWGRVEESLSDEDDTPEDIAQNAEKLLSLSDVETKDCLSKALGTISLDFEGELRERAKKILGDTGSLKTQSLWLKDVSTELSGVLDELKEMRCGGGSRKVEKIIKETSRKEFVVAGVRWNEKEIEEIKGVFSSELRSVAADKLRGLMVGEYKRWQAIAERWSASGSAMVSQAQRLVSSVEEEAIKQDKGESKTLSDIHYSLFCDPGTPEKGIPQINSSSRFYRRELKPMLKYEDRAKALPSVKFPEGLEGLIFEQLESGFDGSEANLSQKFRNQLEQTLKEGTVVTPRDIKRKFQISKVVVGVKNAWEKHFLKLVNNADEYELVSQSFQQFFGFKPDYNEGLHEINLGSEEEMIVAMAQSISNTCNPYWKLKISSQENVRKKTSVFIPGLDLANNSALHATIESSFQKNTGNKEMDFNVSDSHNPFMLLAYNCAGVSTINQIASIDYWKEAPGLVDVLKRAELDSGETIFEAINTTGGRGYTSPIFVNEAVLKEGRWRPWVSGDDKEAATERGSAIEALYYALLDVNHDDIDSVPFQNYRQGIVDAGWKMPLLREGEGKKFRFTRNEVHFDEKVGEVKDNATSIAWQDGDMAGVRIHRVLDTLLGEAVKGESGWIAFFGDEGFHLLGEIREESREFFEDLGDYLECPHDSKPVRALAEKMTSIFRDRAMDKKASSEETSVWKELMDYANKMAGNENE